jgi:subfamily B ATP-binding cassette protein MsbA
MSLQSRIASARSKVGRLVFMTNAIRHMSGRHLTKLYIACFLLLAVGVAEGSVVIVLVSVATNILGSVELPPFFKSVMSFFGLENKPGFDTGSLITLIAFLAMREVVMGLVRSYIYLITPPIISDIRDVVLDNLLTARFGYLDRFERGTFRQVLLQECGRTVAAAQSIILMLGHLLTIAVILALMIYMVPYLALIATLLALTLIPARLLYARWLNRFESRSLDQQFALTNTLEEALVNIRLIKLVGLANPFLRKIYKMSMRTMWLRAYAIIMQTWDPLFLYISALGIISVIVFLNDTYALTTAPELLAFFVILYRILVPSVSASGAFNQILANEPHVLAAMRFFQPEAGRKERQDGAIIERRPIDTVRFDDVAFGYSDTSLALKKISLVAKRGEITALVGPSGAGKSSISNLLLGMYQRKSGAITLESPDWNSDIDAISLESLRGLVGVVTQDVGLLNETVREVIRGGDKTVSEADVETAARRADAHEFILSLSDGYETTVGERGILLSGGQRQRLLIAQIFARRTPVLILDEATSALDLISERRVYETLNERKNDCLILLITHRISSLADFENIYVLEDGEIAEYGSWDDLLDRRGKLHDMLSKDEASPESAPGDPDTSAKNTSLSIEKH